MIRLVLAEDQTLLRGALASLLSLEPDLAIVAEAANGQDALLAVREHRPDILLTDIEMPGMPGIELAEAVLRLDAPPKVVIITTFIRQGYVERARMAGVHGYLLKDAPSEQLVALLRDVAAGQTHFAVTHDGLSKTGGQDPLTAQERRVLRRVEEGLTNKEIARNMSLTPGTVRNYLSRAGLPP